MPRATAAGRKLASCRREVLIARFGHSGPAATAADGSRDRPEDPTRETPPAIIASDPLVELPGAAGHVDQQHAARFHIRLDGRHHPRAVKRTFTVPVRSRRRSPAPGLRSASLPAWTGHLVAGLRLEDVDVPPPAPGSGSQLPAYSSRATLIVRSAAASPAGRTASPGGLRRSRLPAA